LQLSLDPEFNDFWNKLYLKDPQTEEIVNLASEDFFFSLDSEDIKVFDIYWGNFVPMVILSTGINTIHQGGNHMLFNWNVYNKDLIEYQKLFLVNETDSLVIVDHLMNTVDHYKWMIPDDITMHNASIGIEITTTEGKFLSTLSNYKVGIVPTFTTLSNDPGWHMVANPWPEEQNLIVEEIFGLNSTLWIPLVSLQYEQTEDFKFGKGFWVNSPEGYEYSSDSDLLDVQCFTTLQPGWNLVANPHNCTYKLKDIYFKYNGVLRSFAYMQYLSIIPDIIVSYDENTYTKVDSILPLQSFYIYANMNSSTELQCRFTPYFSYSYLQPVNDWQVKIKANQVDGDELILGTAPQATDDFEFKLDLPHPPLKPFLGNVELYIPKEIGEIFIYDKLCQEYKESLSKSIADTVRWDFEINASSSSTVSMKFDLTGMPKNYKASIYINDNSWCNLVNNVYVYAFTPNDISIINGFIEIRNNFTGVDDLLPTVFDFTNYPNPFNPKTNIQFSLNKETEVELIVYNLKGQKVKFLLKDKLAAGEYNITWNGRDDNEKQVASGIYFIRLDVEDHTWIRKSILLK
jgi:hypothetical protein